MAMLSPASASPIRLAALNERSWIEHAPTERLIRASKHAAEGRDLGPAHGRAPENRSHDDQFVLVFQLMINNSGTQEPAQPLPLSNLETVNSISTRTEETAQLTTGTVATDGTADSNESASRQSKPAESASTAAAPSWEASSESAPIASTGCVDSPAAGQTGAIAVNGQPDANSSARQGVTTVPVELLQSFPRISSSPVQTRLNRNATEVSAVKLHTVGVRFVDFPAEVEELSPEVVAALDGIGRPTPMKAAEASPVQSGRHVTGISHSGTSSVENQSYSVTNLTTSATSLASEHLNVLAAIPECHAPSKRPTQHDGDTVSLVKPEHSQTTSMLMASVSSGSGSPELFDFISVELRQPMTYQFTQAVVDRLERGPIVDRETLTVQLDPPELGEIVIELSKTLDGLAVRVTAREAVTMDMLLARGGEIESQLRFKELDLNTIEFLSSDRNRSGFDRQQSDAEKHRMERQPAHRSVLRPNVDAASIPGSRPLSTESRHALSFKA